VLETFDLTRGRRLAIDDQIVDRRDIERGVDLDLSDDEILDWRDVRHDTRRCRVRDDASWRRVCPELIGRGHGDDEIIDSRQTGQRRGHRRRPWRIRRGDRRPYRTGYSPDR